MKGSCWSPPFQDHRLCGEEPISPWERRSSEPCGELRSVCGCRILHSSARAQSAAPRGSAPLFSVCVLSPGTVRGGGREEAPILTEAPHLSHLSDSGAQRGSSCPPRDTGKCLQMFLVLTAGRKGRMLASHGQRPGMLLKESTGTQDRPHNR